MRIKREKRKQNNGLIFKSNINVSEENFLKNKLELRCNFINTEEEKNNFILSKTIKYTDCCCHKDNVNVQSVSYLPFRNNYNRQFDSPKIDNAEGGQIDESNQT